MCICIYVFMSMCGPVCVYMYVCIYACIDVVKNFFLISFILILSFILTTLSLCSALWTSKADLT